MGLRPVGAEPALDDHCALLPGPSHTVVRVLDAETIALDDGSEVRLIGALAPRPPRNSPGASAWPPERLAREALEGLLLGRTVELKFAGRRTDRYGRALAHVFVDRAGEKVWVQGHLLSQGLARAYALPGNTACLKDMLAHERTAREAGLGLWASAAYAVREANEVGELLKRRNRFEIVEGDVVDVAEVGGRVYLNFGIDWRRDFTAAVAERLVRASSGGVLELKSLIGKRVRVRGWIERRNGPLLDLADLALIEVIGNPGPTSPGRSFEPSTPQTERGSPAAEPNGARP